MNEGSPKGCGGGFVAWAGLLLAVIGTFVGIRQYQDRTTQLLLEEHRKTNEQLSELREQLRELTDHVIEINNTIIDLQNRAAQTQDAAERQRLMDEIAKISAEQQKTQDELDLAKQQLADLERELRDLERRMGTPHPPEPTITNEPATPVPPTTMATPPTATTPPEPTDNISVVELEVYANQAWQASNVRLRRDQEVTIQYLSGTWTGGYGNSRMYDGEGDVIEDYRCAGRSAYPGRCGEPLPNEINGKLVGRIDKSVFAIGNNLQSRSPAVGALELRMNDDDPGLWDNSGSIHIRITIRSIAYP